MPSRDYYLPERKLVSQDEAAIIERPNVPRSRFIGVWTRKMTFDAGYLVPFLLDEVLPGDHLSYNITAYVRMSTPVFPIYDNQRIDTFIFFVPNRLVWSNWPKFMGEQADPTSSIAFTVPQIVSDPGFYAVGSIYDHFALPVDVDSMGAGVTFTHSALPLRGYNLIYNQWFRDQNIIDSAFTQNDDGPDLYHLYFLQRRAKSPDYFASALPWPQKFTAPTVPVGGLAPIVGLGTLDTAPTLGSTANVRQTGGGTATYDHAYSTVAEAILIRATAAADAYPSVYADLSQATGVAINTFRQAFMVQSLLERDARGGTRYVELIRSHFGVTNPDFRLQRPEYIGGGQTPLNITPIAQTAPTTGLTVGALGAAGTAAGQHRASYAATEHGYIIGLINVKSELSYQQGVHKSWKRLTRYDFYWPALASLGEQAIIRQELQATGADADMTTVFGYQERWHEYRTRYSEVTGKFRSDITGTLDGWHLSQYLTAGGIPPTLSQAFIEDTPPMDRVLAAGGAAVGQQYLADIEIQRTAVRPIPQFGTPAVLGRF